MKRTFRPDIQVQLFIDHNMTKMGDWKKKLTSKSFRSDFMYSLRMPKETPRMAGTMMNTNKRVNHTVKEMPRSIQIRLSNGKR